MKPISERWLTACLAMANVGFDKNERQREILDWWINSDVRFMQVLGGERSGKSLLVALIALIGMKVAEDDRELEYWIVGPDYRQARPEFLYLYNWLKAADWIEGEASMPANEAMSWSMRTKFGANIRTRSASEVQKLASFSVDGVIMAEAAQCIYEVYLKLMGRVSETRGFLILSGTLEDGLPWYGDLYERWQGSNVLGARSWSLPSWSNLEIYPGGRDDPAIKELESEYPPDLFMERFGAVPRKRTGLVLPEFDMTRHVKRLVVDPTQPVYLAIDPGQHCYAVLFLQFKGLYTYVLDRIYERGLIAQEIIPKAMGNPLWKYIQNWDAGAIDNAGKQHQANYSQIELWQKIAGVSLQGQYIKLDDTIQTIRYRLGDNNPHHEPLIYFNDHMSNARSPDGLALDVLAEPLSWSWPKRAPGRNEAARPVDRNNDAMKALGYALVYRYGLHTERKRQETKPKRSYWMSDQALERGTRRLF